MARKSKSKLIAGLKDMVVRHARGEQLPGARTHYVRVPHPINVRAIRVKLASAAPRLYRANPVIGKRQSLGKIAAKLAAAGHVTDAQVAPKQSSTFRAVGWGEDWSTYRRPKCRLRQSRRQLKRS